MNLTGKVNGEKTQNDRLGHVAVLVKYHMNGLKAFERTIDTNNRYNAP